MFKLAALFKSHGPKLASLFTTLTLTACASPSQADNIYINTMISGELMPGVYGQVNIGTVPDYVTVYEQPMIIVPQPVYAVPMQPIYLYVPPYHAYHWRDHCGYYNACARPVYFVCARDYRPHYFQPSYYNTRVYDPPRVYHHHHAGHNRHYETMYQREMNRDSQYHRVDNNKGPYYRHSDSYYGGSHSHHNEHHRHNSGHRDNNNRDNDRQHHRDDRNDKNPQRQQFISNDRNDDNRQLVRQQYSTPQPQRGDVIRTRGDSYRNDNYRSNNYQSSNYQNHGKRNEVRQAEYRQTAAQPNNRVQMNAGQTRERTSMPMQQSRQPSFQGQQSRSVGQQQGGGHPQYRREEKR